jgi:muramoyltetrapeptide carboxypeptidase
MKKIAEPFLPPPVKKGDTIGIIAPAGPVEDRQSFEAGLALLESFGFRVKIDIGVTCKAGYLSGTDAQRTSCFQDAWSDPNIKAIVAARGGFGSMRMLSSIDMALLRNNPKRLIGFSDLTCLLTAMLAGTNLVGFHGPMVATLAKSDQSSIESFFAALTEKWPQPLHLPEVEIIKSGKAAGRLLGGNLTTLAHLIGTRFEPPWRNTILFLEDVGEALYRVDRLLTHLKEAGCLGGISGLILGSFEKCGDYDLIISRAGELLYDLNIPIWANFPVGHGECNRTLPVGIHAVMDSESRRILYNNSGR